MVNAWWGNIFRAQYGSATALSRLLLAIVALGEVVWRFGGSECTVRVALLAPNRLSDEQDRLAGFARPRNGTPTWSLTPLDHDFFALQNRPRKPGRRSYGQRWQPKSSRRMKQISSHALST